MEKHINAFRKSLSAKLAYYLILSMIVIFGVTGVMNHRMYRRHLMEGVYQNADQISDIIKRSTNYSMLRNERDSIYEALHNIGREPGILKIRIYNKEGQVSFSTDPAEVNMEVNVKAEACIVCHGGPMPSADAPIQERTRDYYNSDNQHVLGVISPIKSEQSCLAADCHAHDPSQKVLGVLDVIMKLDKVDAHQKEYERRFLLSVIWAIFTICLISGTFIYFMVFRPVNKIVEGTRRVADGDLDSRIDIRTKDEIGFLAESFNSMAGDLKDFRHELLTAKAYTDNIINSMSNSLVVINQNAIIKEVNRAACELLEYTEIELIGRHLSVIFAHGCYEDIGLLDTPITDYDRTVESAFVSKNGKKIHVLFSGSVIRDNQGGFQGVACLAQDISWHTEAMNAGHLTSIGELAAGVAHEINNPMNSIINFAQIMIDEISRNHTVPIDIPKTIIKEGDRVSGIVKSLLSFAREHERVKHKISIQDVLKETLALTQTQLVKDGIILQIDVPDDLPEIIGDFQQIQQVFINIINNSRYALNEKFPGAHPEKILSIQAGAALLSDKSGLNIIFRDNGTGIPANLLEKVVNPFFSTKPAGIGTGLGLAISHGIITDHDGKLTIESIRGSFTSVSIFLPEKKRT